MENQFRYPGPNPFSAEQVDVFFGRDQDAEILCNSVLLNRCTVLVGKSGIGKSSLVNAKVIPYFRSNLSASDRRHFKVLRITVGPFTPLPETPHYETLLEKVRKKVKNDLGILEVPAFLPFLSEVCAGSLGYDLKQYQHASLLSNKHIIFLMVIDQVEELFTYPYGEFKELLNALNEVLSPNIPGHVRDIIESVEQKQPALISQQEATTLYTPVVAKFLFSIRSDKLGLLIRLKEAISDIFTNPYELRPLSKAQAYKAIKLPAEKEGLYDSPSFSITDDAINKVIEFLWNLPNSDLESNFDDLKIDPITLQIVCQHIEQKLLPVNDRKIIESEEIVRLEEVFGNYYLDVLSQLQLDDVSLFKVRELIEERLIYEPDKRRRQLFFDECQVNVFILKKLITLKFLREVTASANNSYIEIGHDWLVLPILNAKKKRLEEEARQKEERVKIRISSESLTNDAPPNFQSMKKKGDEMHSLREYQQAIYYYSNALQDENARNFPPELNDLFFKRGECYHKTSDFERSNEDFSVVLRFDADNLLAKFYLAFNAHMQKDYERAVLLYNYIIEASPSYINAYYNLGFVYRDIQDYEKSKNMFLRVTEEIPHDADAWYHAGVMANNQLFFAEALGYLQSAVRLKPALVNAYFELGHAYLQLESFDEAISAYNKIIEYDSSNTEVYLRMEKVYARMGNAEEAEKCFLKAAAINNQDAEVLFKLGSLASLKKQYSEAIMYFNKAILITPDHIPALLSLGVVYNEIKQYSHSIEMYKKALRFAPLNTEAIYYLAHNYVLVDNLQDAERCYLELISINPKDAKLCLELGDFYMKQQEREKAFAQYEKAVLYEPRLSKAWVCLGDYFRTSGKPATALEKYREAMDIDHQNWELLLKIGETELELGDNRNAYKHFLKASSIQPDNLRLKNHLQTLDVNLDDLPDSGEQLLKAMEINDALQKTINEIKKARNIN